MCHGMGLTRNWNAPTLPNLLLLGYVSFTLNVWFPSHLLAGLCGFPGM